MASLVIETTYSDLLNTFTISILPAKDFPWSPDMNPPPKILAVNKIIEQYAKVNNMIYLDYYSSMVDKNFALIENYGSDGVHPNRKGYQVMSSLADKAINEIISKPIVRKFTHSLIKKHTNSDVKTG